MSRATLRYVLIVFMIGGGIAVLLISWVVRKPKLTPPPRPNGYEDFMKAAGQMSGNPGGYAAMDHDQLQGLIVANGEALALLRLGLSRRCAVPTEDVLMKLDLHIQEVGNLKALAQLPVAEGWLAEMENRPFAAATNYVDSMRFGNEISRGGANIDRLVGIACEALGSYKLAKLVPQLDCERSRILIAQLEKIDESRVSWQEVAEIEKQLSRHLIRNNPALGFALVMSWSQTRDIMRKCEARHNRAVAQTRLLATEMALRCYQSEHGCGPRKLEELVPKHLTRVPIDPFRGLPLTYKPQGTNWLLYSIGPDRTDDGGVPATRSTSGNPAKGDLLFDSSP